MSKSSKVLEFAHKQTAKAWEGFRIMPMRPSLNPNEPALYLIDVMGKRMDGVVFTVTVAIRKDRHDLLPPTKTIDAMIGVMNDGIRELLGFTGCGCDGKTECEKHKRPVIQ